MEDETSGVSLPPIQGPSWPARHPLATIGIAALVVLAIVLTPVLLRSFSLSAQISASRTRGPYPLPVAFQAQVTGGLGQPGFFWDFGEGNSSTGQNPAHTFRRPGVFNITLTVRDQLGTVRTATRQISVLSYGLFDFVGSLASPKSDLSIAGLMVERFQVDLQSNTSVGCKLTVDRQSAHDGSCRSFVYVFKTKKSAELRAKFQVNMSFHRNDTDARLSVTISGEVSGTFTFGGDVSLSSRDGELPVRLEEGGELGTVAEASFNGTLLPGESANYSAQVSGEMWINITANVTVTVKIEEEITTIVRGDCRKVEVFSWIRRSAQIKVDVKVTIMFRSTNPNSSANYGLSLAGPSLTRVP